MLNKDLDELDRDVASLLERLCTFTTVGAGHFAIWNAHTIIDRTLLLGTLCTARLVVLARYKARRLRESGSGSSCRNRSSCRNL
jgi:hypothetical protein